MTPEQAEALLQALGSKAHSKHGSWVRGPCVLAPWLHKSGKDTNPSFGLFVEPGEKGRFHCFACESGSLDSLLQTLEFHLQRDPQGVVLSMAKAREIVENDEVGLPSLPEFSEFMAGPQKKFIPIPETALEDFPPVPFCERPLEYLAIRNVSYSQIVKFGLRYDFKKDRVLFPYYTVFGRFAGIRGRGVEFPGEPPHPAPHHDYVWDEVNNTSLVWYNEQVLDEPGPVVIVEGQFDAMRVSEVYPRVLANLTAKPSPAKMNKLAQCEGVILMLDGDAAGLSGTTKFAECLNQMGLPWTAIFLPTVNEQGVQTKTDPDTLGVEWITSALKKVGLLD